MSQTSKIVLGIAIAAVVLLGAYYYWHVTQREPATGETGAEVTTLPTGAASDDASLEEDLAAIDAQIQDVSTDNANAAASVDAAVQ